jgi:hypothetical protein
LFLEKRKIRKSSVFGDINEKQIFLTYINETVNIGSLLRDLVYTYEYKKIITSIQTIILNEES